MVPSSPAFPLNGQTCREELPLKNVGPMGRVDVSMVKTKCLRFGSEALYQNQNIPPNVAPLGRKNLLYGGRHEIRRTDHTFEIRWTPQNPCSQGMHTMPGASRFYTAPEAARTASVDCGGETGPLMAWGDVHAVRSRRRTDMTSSCDTHKRIELPKNPMHKYRSKGTLETRCSRYN